MSVIPHPRLRALPGSGPQPSPGPEEEDAADRAAVERVLDGDGGSFEQIARRHAGRLVSLCVRVTGSREVGEELAQEALVRAYTRLGSFRGDCRVRHWLLRIALNGCRDWLKAGARAESSAELSPDALETALTPERTLAGRQAIAALSRAIAALPQPYREAFNLFHAENLPYEEMRRITGVRVGALKVRVHRAREMLRRALGERLEDLGEDFGR